MQLVGSSLVLLLAVPLGWSYDWGEDRPIPTEACEPGGGGTGPPPTCDEYSETVTGVDECGCFEVVTSTFVCPWGTSTSERGTTCSGYGAYAYQVDTDESSAGSGELRVSDTRELGFDVSEMLSLARLAAEAAGWEVQAAERSPGTWEGAEEVIWSFETEVDADDQSYRSLQVDGLYLVLGDLAVEERLTVSGYLIVTGDVTAGEVDLAGAGVESGALDGGMLLALSLVAESIVGEDCLLITRNLLNNADGSIVVSGDVAFSQCHVDAGSGLDVAGDLALDGVSFIARAISAQTLSMAQTRGTRLGTVAAASFTADECHLENGSTMSLQVDALATLTGTSIQARGVTLTAADLVLDAASSVDSLHREDAGIVLPADPDEPAATGVWYEQVPGASLGGYGGTESLFGTSLRPSAPPDEDPRDPEGHGVDGWAFGAADSTRGGGGGDTITVEIGGTAVVDGTLEANGGSAPVGPVGGGGSGGSGGVIRVEAGVLTGGGLLRANGGAGSMQADGDVIGLAGGGGSGGLIAVLADDLTGAALRFEAVGGIGGDFEGVLPDREVPPAWVSPLTHGGPGTVYLEDAAGATLRIDGDGLDPAGLGCAGGPVCRGVGWLPAALDGVDVVIDDATVAVGSLRARSLTLRGARLVVDDPRARLPWPDPGLAGEAEGLAASRSLPIAVYRDPLDERLTWTVDEAVSMDAGSQVDLAGFGGYSRATPEGVEDRRCSNGGSHGGVGGHGITDQLPDTEPEAAYDDPRAPVEPGRGGCSDLAWTGDTQEWCGLGGVGGAALRLDVGGLATLDGVITADGFDGQSQANQPGCVAHTGTAGGAGGAVWITAGSVAGTGTLRAAGGDGAANDGETQCGGGGGGGRVALYAAGGSFDGQVDVAGGTPGCAPPPVPEAGAEGSIVVEIGTDDTGDAADSGEPTGDSGDGSGAQTCGCDGAAGTAGLGALALGVGAAVRRRRGDGRGAQSRRSSTESSSRGRSRCPPNAGSTRSRRGIGFRSGIEQLLQILDVSEIDLSRRVDGALGVDEMALATSNESAWAASSSKGMRGRRPSASATRTRPRRSPSSSAAQRAVGCLGLPNMSPILRLDLPGPVAVLGDIHGRSDLLRRLLAELGDMPVLSVGDVVDRGPDSKGCVELLIERRAVGVMGNHEEWVRSWLGGGGFDDFALSRAMGGAATLDSYGVSERRASAIEAAAGRVPPSHRAWFASLAETIDLGVGGRRYWVTHAAPEDTDVEGEDEARELFETAGQRLRWSAFRPSRVADCGRPVVCGHMCQDEPVITRRCIAIDTGCATTPGGALSAVILPTLRVLTVR